MRFTALIVFLGLLNFSTAAQAITDYSNQGTSFWCGFMDNFDQGVEQPVFSFQITSEAPTIGHLIQPVAGDTLISFSLPANAISELTVPGSDWIIKNSEEIGNKGLRISTADPVQVDAVVCNRYTSEATTLLPGSLLGAEYRTLVYPDEFGRFPTEVLILATANNTTVEMTPTGNTLKGRPGGQAFSFSLQAGETYQVQSITDLTGSFIQSNQPIAVFEGTQFASVDTCLFGNNSANHLWEQAMPLTDKLWGNSYFYVPLAKQGGDLLRILSIVDNTEISLGKPAADTTLSNGESWTLFLDTATVILSNHPIAVIQLNSSESCSPIGLGDPFQINLAPANLRTNRVRVLTPAAKPTLPFPIIERYFINVVIPTADTAQLTLNGQPVTSRFEAFPGFQDLSYTQIEIDTGTHVLRAGDALFQATYYGYGLADGFGQTLDFEKRISARETEACITKLTLCQDTLYQLQACADTVGNSAAWSLSDGRRFDTWTPQVVFDTTGLFEARFVGLAPGALPIYNSFQIEVEDCPSLCTTPSGTAASLLYQDTVICQDTVFAPIPKWSFQPDSFFIAIQEDTFINVLPAQVFQDTGLIRFFTYGLDTIRNCFASSTQAFQVTDCTPALDSILQFPNVFTPDGDGVNDIFAPVNPPDFIMDYYLQVYNRWGDLIFESYTPSRGWDGSDYGEPLPSDVYVFVVRYTTPGGMVASRAGDVTLLR